jgi:YD repeat-containing protein
LVDRGWRGAERFTPIFRDGFRLPDGELVRFTRDARGRVAGFVLWDGRVRHLRFERAAAR